MKITSWNVNSIKARLEHVKKFLQDSAPDIMMVQELKGLEFPAMEFEALGYQCEAVTQKSYNGVAILSKHETQVIHSALPGDEADEQARYIEFDCSGIRMINVYCPNGNPVGTEKYDYKLSWMARLFAHLKELRDERIPYLIGGDFNVIPEDKDCHDPKAWDGDALFRLETHQTYRKLLNLGLTDAYRVFDEAAEKYTFWDYQAGAWQNNNGIRIDHFLCSPEITDRLQACEIDEAPRGWEKPSDHTPISIILS